MNTVVIDPHSDSLHNSISKTQEFNQKSTPLEYMLKRIHNYFLGLDRIEKLQQHENEEIYKLTYKIIDRFFSSEVGELQKFHRMLFFQVIFLQE